MGAPATTDTSMRERKKAQTREAIAEAALRLFTVHGFDATTIDDIAAEVDISPRTFFRYFASKEEVVTCLGDDDVGEVVELLEQQAPDEPILVSLRTVVLAHAVRLQQDRAVMLAQIQVTMRTPVLKARYLETIDAGVGAVAELLARRAGGGPEALLRARVVTAAIVAVSTAAVQHWAEHDGASDLVELIGHGLDLLATSLAEA